MTRKTGSEAGLHH